MLYDVNANLISEEEYRDGKKYAELYYYPSGNLRRFCLFENNEECEEFQDKP